LTSDPNLLSDSQFVIACFLSALDRLTKSKAKVVENLDTFLRSPATDCPEPIRILFALSVSNQLSRAASSVRVAGQLNQLKVGAKKKQNQIGVVGRRRRGEVVAKNELVKWKNWQCSWWSVQGVAEKVLKYI